MPHAVMLNVGGKLIPTTASALFGKALPRQCRPKRDSILHKLAVHGQAMDAVRNGGGTLDLEMDPALFEPFLAFLKGGTLLAAAGGAQADVLVEVGVGLGFDRQALEFECENADREAPPPPPPPVGHHRASPAAHSSRRTLQGGGGDHLGNHHNHHHYQPPHQHEHQHQQRPAVKKAAGDGGGGGDGDSDLMDVVNALGDLKSGRTTNHAPLRGGAETAVQVEQYHHHAAAGSEDHRHHHHHQHHHHHAAVAAADSCTSPLQKRGELDPSSAEDPPPLFRTAAATAAHPAQVPDAGQQQHHADPTAAAPNYQLPIDHIRNVAGEQQQQRHTGTPKAAEPLCPQNAAAAERSTHDTTDQAAAAAAAEDWLVKKPVKRQRTDGPHHAQDGAAAAPAPAPARRVRNETELELARRIKEMHEHVRQVTAAAAGRSTAAAAAASRPTAAVLPSPGSDARVILPAGQIIPQPPERATPTAPAAGPASSDSTGQSRPVEVPPTAQNPDGGCASSSSTSSLSAVLPANLSARPGAAAVACGTEGASSAPCNLPQTTSPDAAAGDPAAIAEQESQAPPPPKTNNALLHPVSFADHHSSPSPDSVAGAGASDFETRIKDPEKEVKEEVAGGALASKATITLIKQHYHAGGVDQTRGENGSGGLPTAPSPSSLSLAPATRSQDASAASFRPRSRSPAPGAAVPEAVSFRPGRTRRDSGTF